MGTLWRRVTPLLGLALLLAAAFALRNRFETLTLDMLWRTIAALPPMAVALAIGLPAINYAVLTGYDILAFSYLGHPLSRWRIALASFVGYAISNNLGFAVLSGATVRYRFYSRWGISPQDISRVVVFYSGT